MPLSLFASRAFAGANLLTLCLYGALSGVLFLLPFELIGRRGLSPSEVGLVLLPMGPIIGVFARPRGGARRPARGARLPGGGRALVALSAAWLGFAAGSLIAGVVVPLMLLAFGMALVVAPLTTTVMNAAPDALAGAASGVNNAASRLAGLFAVALVGAVAALVFAMAADVPGARFGVLPGGRRPRAASVAAAFDRAWSVGMAASALMAALAAAVALSMPAPAQRAERRFFCGAPLTARAGASDLRHVNGINIERRSLMNTAVRGLERARDWLDERGRVAWIAAMVIGFVLFWPIGLALLAYMIWSKRMGCNWGRHHHRHRGMGRTGNTAFDAYREETLKRLEEERDAFVLPRPAAGGEGPGRVRPVHDEPPGAAAGLTRARFWQRRVPPGARLFVQWPRIIRASRPSRSTNWCLSAAPACSASSSGEGERRPRRATARAAASIRASPGTKGSGRARRPKTRFCICSRSWVGEAEAISQPDSGSSSISA